MANDQRDEIEIPLLRDLKDASDVMLANFGALLEARQATRLQDLPAEYRLRKTAANDRSSVNDVVRAMKAMRDEARPAMQVRFAPTRIGALITSVTGVEVVHKLMDTPTEQGEINRNLFAKSLAHARDIALDAAGPRPALIEKIEQAVD